MMRWTRGWAALAAILISLAPALLFAAPAEQPDFQSQAAIQKLVHAAAWNQIQDLKNHERLYQDIHQEITSGNSQTWDEIDTSQGTLDRLTEVNGHPPSKKQCRRNLRHLNRLASSGRLQRANLKEQQSETARRIQLFKAIPNAFTFQYAGIEKGTGLVMLSYRPNPNFHAKSREGAVLNGLAGTMWVDAPRKHIVKINGRVINEVTFGWGFLAKLYPGGHYQLEQKLVGDKDWKMTRLDVHLQGTMLLVKKLSVNMTEIYRDYKQAGPNLTVAGAVAYLKGIHVDCGE